MPLRVINEGPEWRNRAWTGLLHAAQGVPQPPEEPCRKCIRLYGILQSELSTSSDSINDPQADADYALGDIENVVETISIMVESGCIDEGFKRDAEAALLPTKKQDFGKDDVEAAFDGLMNFGEKILEAVSIRCRGSAFPSP